MHSANMMVQDNMDVVFFIYGLAFFCLGLVILVQPRAKREQVLSRHIGWLAMFGLLHGALEWMDLWRVVRGGSQALEIMKIVLLLTSFGCLFEFGRRLSGAFCSAAQRPHGPCKFLGKQIYGVVLSGFVLVLLLIPDKLLAAQIAGRYFLGFGGALLVAAGFYAHLRKEFFPAGVLPNFFWSRKYFGLAAVAFVFYAVMGGLVGPAAGVFPANVINDQQFAALFQHPVQLWRAASAVLAALAVGNILRLFHLERRLELEETLSGLQVANARLNFHVKHIPLGFIAWDREFRVTEWNPAAERMFGWTAEEAMGRHAYELVVPSDVQPLVNTVWSAILSGEDMERNSVNDNITKDGTRLACEWFNCPVYDQTGKVTGCFSFVNDITRRQQAERALQEWTVTLDERVQQRTVELVNARQAAEAANQTKSAFLAMMSHEIRTPMNGVVGMVDLLQHTPLNQEQRLMIGVVKDSAYALLQIIDDILDFSKIEAGKLVLEHSALRIDDVVENVADMLASGAFQKKVALLSYVDPAIPSLVEGDMIRLRQILFNLGGNAIKFSGRKGDAEGGKVVIRAESMPASVDGKVWVRFKVEDNGIGMSQEVLQRIFQPFTQADDSTARRYGGTGLGLSITRNLVELMGGWLQVKSLPGQGSTFEAALPFDVGVQAVTTEAMPDFSGVSVLSCFKWPELRFFVEHYLNSCGATVAQCQELENVVPQAMSALAAGRAFDVILLGPAWDVRERQEALSAIRCQPELANSRVVIFLKWLEEKKEFDAQTIMVRSFPLRRRELLQAVSLALGRARAEREATPSALQDRVQAPVSFEEAEACGKLILVAEDNVTNQDVIRHQLQLLGYMPDVAGNGREALEKWRKRRYGLVLMDCNMPEMDGFEATSAMRAEQPDGRHVPVIAMTANVQADAAERCRAAGMDDYLGKPVELGTLHAMLDKWLGQTDQPEAVTASSSQEKTALAVLDPQALIKMVGNDPATHKRLLKRFVSPAEETIQLIHQACTSLDIAEAGQQAHKLKSSARAIGANQLADACELIELAAKAGNQAAMQKQDARLDELMAQVAECIAGI